MSLDTYPQHSSEPDIVSQLVRCTGNSTSNPTLNYGKNVTAARTAQGVWTLTFKDLPGNFVGGNCIFQATTASGVKGYTATLGDFTVSGTSYTITVNLWDSTFTAVDLSTTQKLSLVLFFKRSGSTV